MEVASAFVPFHDCPKIEKVREWRITLTKDPFLLVQDLGRLGMRRQDEECNETSQHSSAAFNDVEELPGSDRSMRFS